MKNCRNVRISVYNLNQIQVKIMIMIIKYFGEEVISQTFLAKELDKTLSTINYNIKKLKKKGLIE